MIGTGATPISLNAPGVELDGVHTLHSMWRMPTNCGAMRDQKQVTKAVVVGGGLIGFYGVCEALRLADIDTTATEKTERILPFLDADLAKLDEKHVRDHGPDIIVGNGVAAFLGDNGRLYGVKLDNGTELPCQLAVVAVGVRPNIRLAQAAGLEIGSQGGIRVNEYMQTRPGCLRSRPTASNARHRSPANRYAPPITATSPICRDAAGQNLIEPGSASFPGVIHTGICRIFDDSVGFTGLSEQRAREAGIQDIETAVISGLDIPVFMSGELLISKLVAERASGRILGFQCIGPGDVSKRIATLAMAIRGKLTVADLVNADLPGALCRTRWRWIMSSSPRMCWRTAQGPHAGHRPARSTASTPMSTALSSTPAARKNSRRCASASARP